MDWDQAQKLIQTITQEERDGKGLKDAERIVLDAAWRDIPYELAAENSKYTLNYLQRNTAPSLWKLISTKIFNGQKVDKANIRFLLEELNCPVFFGGNLPNSAHLLGRESDLKILKEQSYLNQCIFLYGEPGIGKTVLAAKMIQDFLDRETKFEYIVWQPVHYQPSLGGLISYLNSHLQFTNLIRKDKDDLLQDEVMDLIGFMKEKRCLIILDEVDSLIGPEADGSIKQEYLVFFRRLIEEQHKGCFVLISRHSLGEAKHLQNSGLPAYHMEVGGLDIDASIELLESEGLSVKKHHRSIAETYSGNPWVLKCVAAKVKRFYSGNLDNIISNKTSLGSNIFEEGFKDVLMSINSLSGLERRILITLAQESSKTSESISLSHLLSQLNTQGITASESDLIIALEALEQVCPIEIIPSHPGSEASFILQPMFRRYITKNFHRVTGEVSQYSRYQPVLTAE